MANGEFSPFGKDLFGNPIRPQCSGTMAERFMVPPFTILNAREGAWQARKDAWISLGIRSEIGRGDNLLNFSDTVRLPSRKANAAAYKGQSDLNAIMNQRKDLYSDRNTHLAEEARSKLGVYECYDGSGTLEKADGGPTGTSIFDPVLCELMYRWFCPPAGHILDPFAGGSVRGIVAHLLGRRYTGIELRPEQVAANIEQARLVCGAAADPVEPEDNEAAPTPVQNFAGIWVKRDDLYSIAGARGGKARSCWALAQKATKGLVTAGSRSSPQVNIVAHIGRRLGLPVRAHVPKGILSPELILAQEAGAEIIQHDAGYNSVIKARARVDADESGFTEIPFGMEHLEAVELTALEVINIPLEVKRLVVPVGSGLTLAGILRGLAAAGRDLPVLGVSVGADPTRILDKYGPPLWRKMVEIIPAGVDYHTEVDASLGPIKLDPIYEAKCAAHLRPGDCLWIVGIRQSATAGLEGLPRYVIGSSADVETLAPDQYDFIFGCPPYYDLEVYSDLPGELSALATYADFRQQYQQIITACCSLLRPDRFACFVVGDIRDEKGYNRLFPQDTVQAFEMAGLRLYNTAVLVTSVGSLPIRTGRQFKVSRKLGRTHQYVYVFVKGDPARATTALEDFEGEGE
jgi:hypothetical protein